jgi:hypothetical protein
MMQRGKHTHNLYQYQIRAIRERKLTPCVKTDDGTARGAAAEFAIAIVNLALLIMMIALLGGK